MASVELATPRFTVDLVGEPPNGIYLIDFQAPVPLKTVTYATGPDAEGSAAMRAKPENAHAIARVRIDRSEDEDEDFAADLDTLQALVADTWEGESTLTYELPGVGTAREVECEVVGAQIVSAPTTDGVQWLRRRAEITVDIEVRPFASLTAAAHDLTDSDPFNRDTFAEGRWVFTSGSGTLSVSGGQLVPSNTSAKVLYRTFQAADANARMKWTSGSDHKWVGPFLKRLDSSNYLYTEVGTSTIIIVKKDGGSDTTLASTSYTAANATAHWLEFDITGNVCTFNVYTADPAGGAAPAATVTHTLTGGDATKFGSGIFGNPGIHFSPNDTGQRIDDWRLDAPVIRCEQPANDFEVRDVGGSAPARAVLRVDDIASQARGVVEVGSEPLDVTTPQPVIIDSDLLVVTGMAGAQSSATSGAYDPVSGGNSSILATVAPPSVVVTVCATPTQTVGGRKRIKARVQAATADAVQVRLAWKIGSGALRYEPWVTVPITAQWWDAALAVIEAPEDDDWTAYVQAVAATEDSVAVDYVTVQPAERFARGRAPSVVPGAEGLSARSGFATESGAITGDSLAVGGTWSGSGDADDFSAGSGEATRTTVVDSAGIQNGRLVRASTPNLSNLVAQVDLKMSAVDSTHNGEMGLLARYVDPSNFLFAVLRLGTPHQLSLEARVGANNLAMATAYEFPAGEPPVINTYYTIRVVALANGYAALYFGLQGDPDLPLMVEGFHAELATGEDLDDGGVGLVDHFSASSPSITRTYDNFAAWTVTQQSVMASGQWVELTHDEMRQEAGGRVPVFEGDYLTLPPGDSRMSVEARRFDPADEVPDSGNATDDMALSLTVSERVLLT